MAKIGIMGESNLDKTTQKWYDRFSKLNSQCTIMDIFEHQGRWYYGNSIDAVKSFIENNPQPADFSVWLQDNWEQAKN